MIPRVQGPNTSSELSHLHRYHTALSPLHLQSALLISLLFNNPKQLNRRAQRSEGIRPKGRISMQRDPLDQPRQRIGRVVATAARCVLPQRYSKCPSWAATNHSDLGACGYARSLGPAVVTCLHPTHTVFGRVCS